MEPAQLVDALESLLGERRSVRGFLPEPVPPERLERIFAAAQRAPSNCNVQPWRTYVASGAARNRIREGLLQRVTGGAPAQKDFSGGTKFQGVYRERQVECAVALYDEMGISMQDKQARMLAGLRNFELFDAPHVAFIGMLKSFGPVVALDVGIYLQTLMLTMTAHGVACCAQGALAHYPDAVRQEFDVPEDIGLLCGISFGYEDPGVAANATRTTRQPLTDNVVFRDA